MAQSEKSVSGQLSCGPSTANGVVETAQLVLIVKDVMWGRDMAGTVKLA